MRLAARPDSADCEVEVHVEAACAHLLCESAKGHGADRRAIGLISRRWEAAPIGTRSQFLWPECPPTPDSQTKHYELTSWGPNRPVAIQAWGYLKILGQVTLGEQQAVSPQPLEPPCGILVEGGKRRAAQAGPLKRDDSIGEVTALV